MPKASTSAAVMPPDIIHALASRATKSDFRRRLIRVSHHAMPAHTMNVTTA